jgi:hypothetical protein
MYGSVRARLLECGVKFGRFRNRTSGPLRTWKSEHNAILKNGFVDAKGFARHRTA